MLIAAFAAEVRFQHNLPLTLLAIQRTSLLGQTHRHTSIHGHGCCAEGNPSGWHWDAPTSLCGPTAPSTVSSIRQWFQGIAHPLSITDVFTTALQTLGFKMVYTATNGNLATLEVKKETLC